MDKSHLENTKDFILSLKNFDWILIISHIEEFQSISTNKILLKYPLTHGILPEIPEQPAQQEPQPTEKYYCEPCFKDGQNFCTCFTL